MENKVIDVVKAVLETENVDLNTSQENTENWDSMKQLSIIFELESVFDLSFEPEEIANMKSVKLIIETIQKKGK